MVTRQEKAKRFLDKFFENYFNINNKHLEVIRDFNRENEANDLSVVTRANYVQSLKSFSGFLKDKSFKKVDKKDIQDYFNSLNGGVTPSTLKHIKISLRKFYGWLYDMKRGIYPECVDWIDLRIRERHKKLDKKILTDGDYKNLLKGCITMRDRAIVSFLFSTGARVEEMLTTKIGDLNFDKSGRYVSVKLKGKTGEREIAMISGIAEIQNYLKQHPTGNKKDNLFYALPNTSRSNQPLYFGGVYDMLQELGYRILKRGISAHLFRHSFATKLALRGYNESEMRVLMGWSKSSSMPSRYTWLKDNDVNKKRLIEAGLLKEDLERVKEEAVKDIKCPRCKTMNSFDSNYCNNCFFALSEKSIKQIKEDDKIIINKIDKKTREELYKEFYNKFMDDFKKK